VASLVDNGCLGDVFCTTKRGEDRERGITSPSRPDPKADACGGKACALVKSGILFFLRGGDPRGPLIYTPSTVSERIMGKTTLTRLGGLCTWGDKTGKVVNIL